MNQGNSILTILLRIAQTEIVLKLWLERKIYAQFGFPPYEIRECNLMLQALTTEINDLTDMLEDLGGKSGDYTTA